MLSSPTRPFVRSMLGEQANSQHRSTPSAGFGTERPDRLGDQFYAAIDRNKDEKKAMERLVLPSRLAGGA